MRKQQLIFIGKETDDTVYVYEEEREHQTSQSYHERPFIVKKERWLFLDAFLNIYKILYLYKLDKFCY